jgi:energy-coupling factor transporter ATP-binding protein EcfA2
MSEPAVEAYGLAKSYGDVRVLDGVDLAVRRGSVLALLGPNGAGKTTAVRILATLLKPDAGTARIGGFDVGDGQPLLLIAGPCVMEGAEHALLHARRVKALAARHGVGAVFKASFDKANRTSVKSFRGIGLEAGLAAFEKVKRETGLACLTDVHEAWQAEPAGRVVDVLQVPAFLCSQTDLVVACARHGRSVNVKKGQFVAPRDMRHALAKCREAGNAHVLLTERGFTFGYGHLLIFAPLAAMGAGLHVAAYELEGEAKIDATATVLSVAIPVAVYGVMLYGLYAVLMRTRDALQVALGAGTLALLGASVGLAAAGVGMPVCLVVLALAPVVTVVGYETVGHRHNAQVIAGLAELSADELRDRDRSLSP